MSEEHHAKRNAQDESGIGDQVCTRHRSTPRSIRTCEINTGTPGFLYPARIVRALARDGHVVDVAFAEIDIFSRRASYGGRSGPFRLIADLLDFRGLFRGHMPKSFVATHSRARPCAAVVVLLIASAFYFVQAGPASAQSQKMINWCIGKNNATPQQMARGCTAIIAAHRTKGAILGNAYLNRGLAYKMMGDHDRALKEYNIAISLAPKSPLCY